MMMRYKILACLIVFSLLISYGAHAAEFVDLGPFEGKVVNADTKEPIEGAVVFISWDQRHFFSGSTPVDAQETLTDKNGDFYLPGIRIINPWKRLTTLAELAIFKSGYQMIESGAWKNWERFMPALDYILKIEDRKPIFQLKRLNLEERKLNKPYDPTAGRYSYEKKKFLLQEIDKEHTFLDSLRK